MKRVFFFGLSTCLWLCSFSFGEIHYIDRESNQIEDPREMYIDLVKKAVLGSFSGKHQFLTMIGRKRVNNIHDCVKEVIENGVPGDCVETGVWRGGATILMRAILKAYGDTERRVWVVDSFRGLPRPNLKKYPVDKEFLCLNREKLAFLTVSIQKVMENFAQFDLLDNQVVFLKGWFSKTLPTAPIEQIAVLRLDGDLYESTMDVLTNTYHKVSLGGFVIIDDYYMWKACKQAVDEFRRENLIEEPLIQIDSDGVYWKKAG